jgi:membrane protease YdiL (CAAX protease family)
VLSPALELATGSPLPFMLVLMLLIPAVWWWARLSRAEVGLRIGSAQHHAIAAIYPLIAVGSLAGIATLAGDIDPGFRFSGVVLQDLAIMLASTWLGTLITEEGFFRGALWGLSTRARWSRGVVLLWTSLAFAAWHIAVPLIEEPFRLPAAQLPVYLLNASLLGIAWGLLRLGSGSVPVACSAHAVWNALVYVLFGYGLKSTALGVSRIDLFDPERGLLGLAVNVSVVLLLLAWVRRRGIALGRPA